ncbi:hypothetical protein PMAYCL1PPCAC_21090, partial [Pristionchus mayeri]
ESLASFTGDGAVVEAGSQVAAHSAQLAVLHVGRHVGSGSCSSFRGSDEILALIVDERSRHG